MSPVASDHDARTGHHPHVVDAPAPRTGATGAGGALLPALIVLVIGSIFVSVYLAAFHEPKPHRLPVGIVGTAQQAQQLRTGLDAHAPGGFSVTAYPDRAAAASAVEHRSVYAALVPAGASSGSSSGGSSADALLYGSANGPSVTALLEGDFGALAQAGGHRLAAQDLVPASGGDTRGLSIFYSAFGLVLAGFLFGTMTYQMAPRLEFRWRMTSLAAFSTVGGLAIAAIAGQVFGALPGPFLAVAALTGLMAAAVGGTTMALVRLLGPAGVSVSSVLMLILGNATSGGILPPAFLPALLRPLSEILPVGVGVRAVQGLAYFHGDGVAVGVGVLALWTAVSVGLLYWRDARIIGAEATAAVAGEPSDSVTGIPRAASSRAARSDVEATPLAVVVASIPEPSVAGESM
ncbi:ABC transporter permease [Streptacidiphilus albus]|uniref:ABC transporter permease n=1 Tax=Streptacidiphilus albus TaxID=105425 RepID=UPI0007C80E8D|nr:ABC transporter permease [Streptacidiphilus albus]